MPPKKTRGSRIVTCAFCKGTGRDPNGILAERPCPVCKGAGKVRV